MKNVKTTIPTYLFLAVFGLAIVGILFGSIFDEQISLAIVNTTNPFGMLFETVGFVANMLVPFAGAIVFKGLFGYKKISLKILGVAVLAVSLGVGVYLYGKQIGTFDSDEIFYGFRIKETWLALLIAAVVSLAFAALGYFIADASNKPGLIRVGTIILVAMLGHWVVMHFLKLVGGRPRFRFLTEGISVDVGGGGPGVYEGVTYEFQNWWEFAWFKAPKLDSFKSWPSGHTACASITLCLGLLPSILKKRFKGDTYVFFGIGLAYTLTVAIARIVIGAHFLSDVSTGMLVGSFAIWICSFLGEKLFMYEPKGWFFQRFGKQGEDPQKKTEKTEEQDVPEEQIASEETVNQ